MSTSYGVIIEFSRDEKLQKYRIILSQHTNYSHKWLVPFFDMFTAAMLIFFCCEISKHVQAKNGLSHLDCHFMEWASILPKLAKDDECRLARFHPIRNFLANKTYHFLKLSYRTGCIFAWAVRSL